MLTASSSASMDASLVVVWSNFWSTFAKSTAVVFSGRTSLRNWARKGRAPTDRTVTSLGPSPRRSPAHDAWASSTPWSTRFWYRDPLVAPTSPVVWLASYWPYSRKSA